MYGLLRLLPISGENLMSTAPLEIYFMRKMVACSILILPAIYIYIYIYICIYIYIYIYSIYTVFTVYIWINWSEWVPSE